jgi:hypothetical protein
MVHPRSSFDDARTPFAGTELKCLLHKRRLV